jgi:hypothetical protein
MYAAFILRMGSQVLSAILGGLAVFCLCYAAWLPDPELVQNLLFKALLSGGAATVIVYCQRRYLDR